MNEFCMKPRWLKPGVKLLGEVVGMGPRVETHRFYQVKLRMRLSRGELVVWKQPWGLADRARLEDGGTTMVTDLRIDRVSMFAGLFYGIQGMRIGGVRTLEVAPHLGYGETGIEGVIPANAVLQVEVSVLEERAGA
jgi:hypothetical protein